MKMVNMDFSRPLGSIKPMHAVNNGPFTDNGNSNLQDFLDAGIPYIRNHDASFCPQYGGYHSVDVHYIFQNFEADENNPANYDFILTDRYCQDCFNAGAKVFYRLGSKIEVEIKKYGTVPPKDFEKWARICEHIVAHYIEGWNNGFHMDIQYWEIWNEADGYASDGSSNCWQGSHGAFLEFYAIAACHLKSRFPGIKIGGPAYTSVSDTQPYFKDFLEYMKSQAVPLDFFSYHGYSTVPDSYRRSASYARQMLDAYGYANTELILDEWNYISGWTGDAIRESFRTIPSLKGSSFTAASMLIAQRSPIDLFMYYDARPCAYNGLFDPFTAEKRKPYYIFYMFNKLYQAKTEVQCSTNCSELYAAAATDGNDAYMMVTYYASSISVADSIDLEFCGLAAGVNGIEAEYYILDDTHNCELIRKEATTANRFSTILPIVPYSTMLVHLRKI